MAYSFLLSYDNKSKKSNCNLITDVYKRQVHGRAAYYGEKSIGLLDGGSVVGRLIFEALSE